MHDPNLGLGMRIVSQKEAKNLAATRLLGAIPNSQISIANFPHNNVVT
ncbi:hypothetical protein QQ055_02705 [Geitlerinema calcuttense NRMC-F 0142]|uniref:Uncharacterized protein n=1 Tax=Geitlerinema calcuttense NRMC-F 0142 TaxID=2922238 RepID=A0ABT7LWI3_9CYAN|nr:hypothetical protein [Geitlerinema splendidum]MDL5056380.1 hypothetical protein [Geitlerinema calcuttense NRMC-F 0142]